MSEPLPHTPAPAAPHDRAGDQLPAVPSAAPPEVHSTVQSLVAEYAGAVAPGRVVAIAVATAVAERRSRPGERVLGTPDALEHWRTRTRRRLTEEVVWGLTHGRSRGPVAGSLGA